MRSDLVARAGNVLALTISTVAAPAPTSSCYQNEPEWYGLNVDVSVAVLARSSVLLLLLTYSEEIGRLTPQQNCLRSSPSHLMSPCSIHTEES